MRNDTLKLNQFIPIIKLFEMLLLSKLKSALSVHVKHPCLYTVAPVLCSQVGAPPHGGVAPGGRRRSAEPWL